MEDHGIRHSRRSGVRRQSAFAGWRIVLTPPGEAVPAKPLPVGPGMIASPSPPRHLRSRLPPAEPPARLPPRHQGLHLRLGEPRRGRLCAPPRRRKWRRRSGPGGGGRAPAAGRRRSLRGSPAPGPPGSFGPRPGSGFRPGPAPGRRCRWTRRTGGTGPGCPRTRCGSPLRRARFPVAAPRPPEVRSAPGCRAALPGLRPMRQRSASAGSPAGWPGSHGSRQR